MANSIILGRHHFLHVEIRRELPFFASTRGRENRKRQRHRPSHYVPVLVAAFVVVVVVVAGATDAGAVVVGTTGGAGCAIPIRVS